jgi:hypothetical protein
MCVICVTCLFYCCTTATGIKPNCSSTYIYIQLSVHRMCRHTKTIDVPMNAQYQATEVLSVKATYSHSNWNHGIRSEWNSGKVTSSRNILIPCGICHNIVRYSFVVSSAPTR